MFSRQSSHNFWLISLANMQFFGICAKRRDKVVSPMHSTGLLGTDWGFSISIARLQLRSAAYHGYTIAFDGHPHSSSIGGGRRRRGRQQQPSAITKRRRYSFFMSPHLAAKRCASEEKQSSKSKCSPWQKTMSPWPVKFCLLSSSPSLFLHSGFYSVFFTFHRSLFGTC